MGLRSGFAKSGQFLQVEEFNAHGTRARWVDRKGGKSAVLAHFTPEVLGKSFFA